jgi:hypothetical protein
VPTYNISELMKNFDGFAPKYYVQLEEMKWYKVIKEK